MVINALGFLEGLHLKPAGGNEYQADCPACGDTKKHLYVNLEKRVFYCHKCGFSGRIDDPGIKRQTYIPQPEEEPADPSKLDRVYRLLFRSLPLSKEHKEQLLKRGLPEDRHSPYATLPGHGRSEAVKAVLEREDPSSVPGFSAGERGWYLSGAPGLLIPVKNFKGEIWGVQVRLDNPAKGKYRWLSSKKGQGPKAKARYHVARNGNLERVWITEGPLKADVASHYLGETVVAVPGVNSWDAGEFVKDLVENGVKEAVIAYDADAKENENVARAALKLGRELYRAGIKIFYAVWDLRYKGLDDLLAAGKKPEIVNVKRYKKLIKKGVKKYVNRVIIAGSVVNEPKITQVNSQKGQVEAIRIILLTGRNGKKETITLMGWGDVAKRAVSLKKGQFIMAEGVLQAITAFDKVGSPISATRINLTNFEVVAENIAG
ncbi:DUF3854 domain-containing protein [Moorella naiadis]|uniref:DUF3854 domain-containing protein n=1 Tax=Moorella naiadis (nom. illeg.) TaxID=3093670 RepID=UPI003D9CADA7